jgi:hypothetical protein
MSVRSLKMSGRSFRVSMRSFIRPVRSFRTSFRMSVTWRLAASPMLSIPHPPKTRTVWMPVRSGRLVREFWVSFLASFREPVRSFRASLVSCRMSTSPYPWEIFPRQLLEQLGTVIIYLLSWIHFYAHPRYFPYSIRLVICTALVLHTPSHSTPITIPARNLIRLPPRDVRTQSHRSHNIVKKILTDKEWHVTRYRLSQPHLKLCSV